MRKIQALITAAALLTTGGAFAQTSPQRLTPVDAPSGPISATIDLGKEFPQMKGYVMVQIVNTIAPNTGKPLHDHVGNAEMVRIISGVLTESHNGGPPTAYGPGSVLVNTHDTHHVWANLGKEPVVFIATQVHAAPPPK